MHGAFLLPAVMAIFGSFAVARRLCKQPLLAALLTLFMPVFIISATSVMCDVMMLAFWTWALEFWLAALDRQQVWRFLVAVGLIFAAALTKYYGITLVPLLAAYTLTLDRRAEPHLLFLLVPIAVLFAYDVVTEGKYGHGLLSEAISVSATVSSATRPSHAAQLLMGLAFFGGCYISAPFFVALRGKRRFLALVIGFVGLAVGFKLLIVSWIYLETGEAPIWLEGGVFATVGAGILACLAAHLIRQRNADSLLLFLWIVGTFVFATFCNWSVTGRTFLPMAPAVAILLVRQFQRPIALKYLRLFAVVGVSILTATADYRQAGCGRLAANLFQQRYDADASRVRFLGHWGFQYYMERWGATAFDRNDPRVADGEILVGPLSDPNLALVTIEKPFARELLNFSTLPFVSTFAVGTGAGFYSSFGGPLPWVINKVPPDRYYVVQTR